MSKYNLMRNIYYLHNYKYNFQKICSLPIL
uniref:Uncharacterized protein n=1 Tax=viral metagenome TaxID=1070528 RepID=A0A6C0H7M1_9ZZZZ